MRKGLGFGLASLLVSLPGCSPSGAPAPAAAPARAEKACATAALPITGVCTNADPSFFRTINTGFDTMSPGCKWYTGEVKTSETEALIFRALDCSAAPSYPSPPDAYTFANGKFHGGHSDITLIPIPPGQTAEDVARATIASAPEANRPRCILKPVPDGYGVFPGVSPFEITADDKFTAELDKANDSGGKHCGDHSENGAGPVLWEKRVGYAFFHELGGDRDLLDPASLTFYRRDASGAWKKSLD